jgi:carboxylate-amine ligase
MRSSEIREDAGATLGVEEEFLLLDPYTAEPVDRAAQVIAGCKADGGWTVQPEYAESQVETATGVCVSAEEVGGQLAEARTRLSAAADERGTLLVATGAPVVASRALTLAQGERYARIADHYGAMFSDYLCCGLHIHVGVPDRDVAAIVLNHFTPWLPALLALSVNSPLRQGRDEGYASLRALTQSAFPAAGPPPWVESAADYDRHLARVVESGAFFDERITFWQARLSPHLPTVEIRVSDSVATSADAQVITALCRGIAVAAAADIAAGVPAPRVDPKAISSALWAAARHGLRGPAIDPLSQTRTTVRRQLAALVQRVRPALAEFGELSAVTTGLADLFRRGTGADLQRRTAPEGPAAVARALAARTAGLTAVEAGYSPV